MMCSMAKLNITVQDITLKIIDIMSLNEFPQIPFVIKNYLDGLIKNFEKLESELFFLQDMIELWYIERKHENWSLDNIVFALRLLFNLKHLKVKNFLLVRSFGLEGMSQAYYRELLISYIGKFHLIKCSLVKWLKFLFILEGKRYNRVKIYDSLKIIFK